MMRIQLQLILTAYFVNSGWTLAQLYNPIVDHAITNNADDVDRIQGSIQNLFNSIAKNNVKKSEAYQEIIKQERTEGEPTFNKMKKELQNAQYKNTNKRRNLLKGSNADKTNRVVKREPTGLIIPFGLWETLALKDDPTRYIKAKEKYRLAYPKNEETFREKTRACIGIIESDYMRIHYDVERYDINEEADFEYIRDNHSKIYDRSFKKWSPFQRQSELENPYRLRDISVGKDLPVDPRHHDRTAIYGLPEYVFGCLAKNKFTGKVVEFFVSQEYPITGDDKPTRFIFGFADETLKKIIPLGESLRVSYPNMTMLSNAAYEEQMKE